VAGDQAAAYADPFAAERKKQIANLETLQSNPGSIETSPFYKFLMDTQLKAVGANNAARGLSQSGRGAMALQDRAAGVASQAYFPLLQNASTLAVSGSSPASAGASYARGVSNSQDQAQMAAAARAAAQQRPPQATAAPSPPANTGYGLPSGGATPYGNSNSGIYGGLSGQVDYNTLGYTPSSYAGTGYESTNGNTTTFGYDPYSDPYWNSGVASDVLGAGYDTSPDSWGGNSYSDFGGGA
jgi:hypothetical protein